MNKRLLFFTIGGFIILLLLGTALVFAMKNQKQQDVQATTAEIVKILDEPVVSPVSAFDNNSVWYFNSKARLFRVNTDGSNLSEYPLPASSDNTLERVLWPKTGSDFISISASSQRDVKTFYDSVSKIYINLADNIQYLDWMPDGKRIVYIWRSNDGKTYQLATADADGTGFRMIKEVIYPNLVVKAGNDGKSVLMYRASVEGDTNKVYLANLETGQISTLIDNGINLGAVWFPIGRRFLFAAASVTPNPKIYVFDMNNNQAVDLNLTTTLEKLAVDKEGKYLYAAVSKPDNSGDTFVRIDLSNYKSEVFFEPADTARVKTLFLVGSSVYFTDTRDSKLYMISK